MTDSGRLERALSQRLYLLNRNEFYFQVQGTNYSDYLVNLDPNANYKSWSCECPDHQTRSSLCKHMIFVLIKVLKLNAQQIGPKIGLSISTIENVIKSVKIRTNNISFVSNEEEPTAKRKDLGDCPICYDLMKKSENIIWCRYSCGQNVHKDCFNRWANSGRSKIRCVWCRAEWF